MAWCSGALVLWCALLLLAGCFTKQGIVMPWTLEHRALTRKLDSLSARVEQLDQDRRNSDLELRAALSNQIGTVVERLEILSAKLDDLGSRLGRLAQRAGTPAPARESAPGPGGVNPTALYDLAYSDYTRGRFDLAQQGFLDYLRAFPNSELADNAQYWLGETFFAREQYDSALTEFAKVIARYPESDKAPAAQFKLARCHELLGNRAQAIAEYQVLLERYPQSQEAKLAAENLRLLKP